VSDFELREEPYDGPVAEGLINAVQQEYVSRYGGPDESPVDPSEFAPPDGRFLVGYLDGVPVATGGLRRATDGDIEIKRMYVVPEARGRGLSRLVLTRLEELAREMGATRLILETGSKQPEAIALYQSSGYEQIEGFGHYKCEPLSFSFGKTL
jgi:GNAT superfamily N-acetyltransferase